MSHRSTSQDASGTWQPLSATLTSIAANTGTAADKGIYYTGAAVAAEFDLTAAGRALLDDATATDQTVTLGLNVTTPSSSGCSLLGTSSIGTATYSTLCQRLSAFGAAGQYTGGIITDAGGETLDVAAGTGFIKATDSDTAELMNFDWIASAGIAIATNSTVFIGVKYNGGSPIIDTRSSQNWDLDTEFPLGSVININGVLHILNNPWWVGDGITNLIEKSVGLGGYLARDNFVGGLILGVTATRYPTMTKGTVWGRTNEFEMRALDYSTPNVASHSAVIDVDNGSSKGTITASAGTPYTTLQSGENIIVTGTVDNNGTYKISTVVGGNVITMTTVIAGADGTEATTVLTTAFSTYWFDSSGTVTETTGLLQYPVTQWNDVANDTLTNLLPNKYANWWVILNITNNEYSFIYPTAYYSSSAEAESEAVPSTIPGDWYLEGILVGRIIFKTSTDVPEDVQSVFTTNFSASLAADHGNLAGLSDDDHTIYLLADGTRDVTGSLDISDTLSSNVQELRGIVGSYTDSEEVALQAGVQTSDATVTQIAAIALTTNTMVTVEARFNGFKSDYSEACGGFLKYTARRAAAGAIEVSTPNITIDEDSAGDPEVDADVSGNNVRLLVTGIAAETWNWVVSYRYNFVKTSA